MSRRSTTQGRRHRGPVVLPSDIVAAFRQQADVELVPALGAGAERSRDRNAPSPRPPMFVLLDRGHRALEVPELLGGIREARKALRWQQPPMGKLDLKSKRIGSTYDCDDFSLALKSFFSRLALGRRSSLPYCVGIVGCRWFDDESNAYQPHVLCWALTSDARELRLWFIDPQQGIDWDSDEWLSKSRNLFGPLATTPNGQRRYKDHFLVLV